MKMLYPQLNESRLRISLDGIWDFKRGGESLDVSLLEKGFGGTETMAVPASYNEQKSDKTLFEHYGYVYYQRKLKLPLKALEGQRTVLYFSAVTHSAVVYFNGKKLCEHKGGFLPFEAELDPSQLEVENLLTVAVDNRVNTSTLPVGNDSHAMFSDGLPDFESVKNTSVKPKNYPNFDFFNYCGINRSVYIYTTPKEYISDITVFGDMYGNITAEAECFGGMAQVEIYDGDRMVLKGGAGESLKLENPVLWEPLKPYLYTARFVCGDDSYEVPFGFRSVEVRGTRFLINGKPFYFKGFGKHEDSDTHGRGIDEALNVKDVSLIKWINANSFRTSHYPYSEEMLSLCDREGIVVIAETSAVGLNGRSYASCREHHRDVIKDMIARDKNHPCIVMWSLANEPDTECEEAYDYFMPLYELAHSCDPQNRPVTTVVCNNNYLKDRVVSAMDVMCVNRYYGWYIFGGDTDAAAQALDNELKYFESFGKPIIITEYGADAVSGVHSVYANMFTEEYQVEFYKAFNSVLDNYSFVAGEQVWNFADFATVQGLMRVDGNKKGIFTRERRPKLAAHYLKKRWSEVK